MICKLIPSALPSNINLSIYINFGLEAELEKTSKRNGIWFKSFFVALGLTNLLLNFVVIYEALPRARVSINSKSHQLGWPENRNK